MFNRNIGATNHSQGIREENDYYATEPIAAELLLEVMPKISNIWNVRVDKDIWQKYLIKQEN